MFLLLIYHRLIKLKNIQISTTGLEPILYIKTDFESVASTYSAK